MERYPLLFSEIKVGSRVLPNRILLPAMDLHYTPEGEVTQRLVSFYSARARGGPSIVVVGGCRISPEAAPDGFIAIDHDRFIPGLTKLSSAIRDGGALPVAQLFHAGRYLKPSSPDIIPIAPSPVVSRLSGVTPREMDHADIQEVIGAYVDSAKRAVEAGFEGVEVIGSAGYLPAQFASPVTNRREDGYGGDFEGRSRFGRELVSSLKKSLPQGILLIFRMGFSDLVPGGLEGAEAVRYAKLLSAEGLDMLSLTGGWHEAPVPMITMDVPRGAFLPEMARFKQALEIPVAGANRVNVPDVAESALSMGFVDMVAVGRAFLADPEWGLKARKGSGPGTIPCTACNEGCMDRIFRGKDATCALNPQAGFEDSRPTPRCASPKRVAVVGSGPAGLNAAIWLRRSGHRVDIFERDAELGGLLGLAHLAPGKSELKTYLEYLIGETARLGVGVNLRWDGTPPDGAPFDAIVLAPGREPSAFPGEVHFRHLHLSFADAIRLTAPPAGPGVVIGGGEMGVEVALHLAKIGAKVTVVHRHAKLAADLGPSTRWVVLKHFADAGIQTFRGEALRLAPSACVCRSQGGEEIVIPARWSVWAVQGEPLRPGDFPVPDAWKSLPAAHLGAAWSDGRIADWTLQAYELAVRWAGL